MTDLANVVSLQSFRAMRADAKLNYIDHARDARLAATLRDLVENVEACREGFGSARRALFLIGDSRSGKSWALKHHFSLVPELQSYENEFGETVRPLLSIEAPKPCTSKDFARAILDAIGVPSKSKMTEGELYATVRMQLRERGIVYLHVDEAQHLLHHTRKDLIHDVQDRLKSLMQIDDWPLHTIYSGVPELANLLKGDQQLANRSLVIRFIPVGLPEDKAIIQRVIKETAIERCGLRVTAELDTDDFLCRLCHANAGSYGKIIETVQAACILVMKKAGAELDRRAFVHVYQAHSGCLPSDNVFSSARWSEINPANALADLEGVN
ncbi:TniB family NTP-binding protein [Pararhizobium antarcticum]|uniref:Transposase n=1 Tax=Pararhizobium antarcticum TaxID=1798805 RepID=A0A657LYC6_9HYPH|nr:TniB family NTP-binding protein [Pararhizobium antarcticum]OJG00039.1 transposase [Pararhizobium antarcticum]